MQTAHHYFIYIWYHFISFQFISFLSFIMNSFYNLDSKLSYKFHYYWMVTLASIVFSKKSQSFESRFSRWQEHSKSFAIRVTTIRVWFELQLACYKRQVMIQSMEYERSTTTDVFQCVIFHHWTRILWQAYHHLWSRGSRLFRILAIGFGLANLQPITAKYPGSAWAQPLPGACIHVFAVFLHPCLVLMAPKEILQARVMFTLYTTYLHGSWFIN